MPTASRHPKVAAFFAPTVNVVRSNVLFAPTAIAALCVLLFVPQVSHVIKSSATVGWGLAFLVVACLIAGAYVISPFAVLPESLRRGAQAHAGATQELEGIWRGVFKLLALLFSPIRWLVGLTARAEPLFAWPVYLLERWSRRACLRVSLLFFALAALGFYCAFASSGKIYPLFFALPLNTGWLLLSTGIWMFLRYVSDEPARKTSKVSRFVGPVLAWAVYSTTLGEALWLLASLEPTGAYVSYRFYTVWGLVHTLTFVVLGARLIDFLAELFSRGPVRLVAVAAFAGWLIWSSNPEQIRDAKIRESTDSAKANAWYSHFRARIEQVPEDEPVVLVLASGGGSRAAVFTAMALEALAKEPAVVLKTSFERSPKRTFADNLILLSSVSGGSLATAEYVFNRGAPGKIPAGKFRYTTQAELDKYLLEILPQSRRLVPDDLSPDVEAALQHYESFLKGEEAGDDEAIAEYRAIFASPLVDAMCMDFMAPLLRGVASLGVDRGLTLYSFWNQTFGWTRSTSVEGYPLRDGKTYGFDPVIHPVVLFNATTVEDGARLIAGFPALPFQLFKNGKGKSSSRGLPRSLSDVLGTPERQIEVDLARAVRMSSNFPWGLPSGVIEVEGAPRMEVLDGGVLDNTGIDSVVELFARLTESTEGGEILDMIQRRGVILVEIDSGAKPTGPSALQACLGGIGTPIQALANAGYNIADLVKSQNVRELSRILVTRASARKWAKSKTAQAPSALKLAKPCPTFVFPTEIEFGKYEERDEPAVMTAWSLGPEDKAQVHAQFLRAHPEWRASVDKLQPTSDETIQAFTQRRREWLDEKEVVVKNAVEIINSRVGTKAARVRTKEPGRGSNMARQSADQDVINSYAPEDRDLIKKELENVKNDPKLQSSLKK